MNYELIRKLDSIKKLFLYKLIIEILFTLLITWIIFSSIHGVLFFSLNTAEFNKLKVLDNLQRDAFNQSFSIYVGSSKSYSDVRNFLSIIDYENELEPTFTVKFYSDDLCVHTDKIDLVTNRLKYSNTYSISIDNYSKDGRISGFKLTSSDYSGKNTVIKEDFSPMYTKNQLSKNDKDMQSLDTSKQDEIVEAEKKEMVIRLAILVFTVISVIILILKYKKSLNTEFKEKDIDRILEKEKIGETMLTLLLAIGVVFGSSICILIYR